MVNTRAVVVTVVSMVVLTAVAFGPLVSGLSLAEEPATEITGDGQLVIDSAEFPTSATVGSASYGAANAYLSTPPTTARFDSIRGNPILIYKLRVSELGYTVSTTHFLDADKHGPTYEATIDPMSVNKSRFTQGQYAGELTLGIRDSDGRRVAARQNITVEVTE